MLIVQKTISLQTPSEDFVDITSAIEQLVTQSKIQEGSCHIYCPHTTAGITINENADPTVVQDLLYALRETFPDRPQFRHLEGNSAAHLKSSVVGCEKTIPISKGQLLLGRWQGIYFCEFDGPRHRSVKIQLQGNAHGIS